MQRSQGSHCGIFDADGCFGLTMRSKQSYGGVAVLGCLPIWAFRRAQIVSRIGGLKFEEQWRLEFPGECFPEGSLVLPWPNKMDVNDAVDKHRLAVNGAPQTQGSTLTVCKVLPMGELMSPTNIQEMDTLLPS